MAAGAGGGRSPLSEVFNIPLRSIMTVAKQGLLPCYLSYVYRTWIPASMHPKHTGVVWNGVRSRSSSSRKVDATQPMVRLPCTSARQPRTSYSWRKAYLAVSTSSVELIKIDGRRLRRGRKRSRGRGPNRISRRRLLVVNSARVIKTRGDTRPI